ncbi:head-tail connector protein [Phascolarctobacterium faecium]|uniref:head-tail connector protein n=1 Tax=Phascolarctobacterium faecium TaxID=33025 RepID=UPI003520E3D1
MVDLEEMKAYLRVDGDEEDGLIEKLMETAERLSKDVARDDALNPATMRMAMLYATAYLYEHREEADHNDLLLSLRALLMGERKAAF